MGIKQGEEVQAKNTLNIVNKIIAENFQNLKKEMPIHVKESSRISNRHELNRICPQHIFVKTTSTENKKRILKAIREKKQITCNGKLIITTTYFLTET
jgi:hypothetical protein